MADVNGAPQLRFFGIVIPLGSVETINVLANLEQTEWNIIGVFKHWHIRICPPRVNHDRGIRMLEFIDCLNNKISETFITCVCWSHVEAQSEASALALCC